MEKNNNKRLFARDVGLLIDASVLKTDAVYRDLDDLAAACKRYGFICAFTWPAYTKLLIDKLQTEKTGIGATVSFPSGQETTCIKAKQAEYFVNLGVDEVDMVMNVGLLKSGQYEDVRHDIRAVKKVCGTIPLKVIIEAMLLSDGQIEDACKCVMDAGADYVKSGTGFCSSPTTIHHVKIMKQTVGDKIKIKVAGGVRDLTTLLKMHKLGVSRFGVGLASAISIMEDAAALNEGMDINGID